MLADVGNPIVVGSDCRPDRSGAIGPSIVRSAWRYSIPARLRRSRVPVAITRATSRWSLTAMAAPIRGAKRSILAPQFVLSDVSLDQIGV